MPTSQIYDDYALNVTLRDYAGRRLQYAIRLGILPEPEQLNHVLGTQTNHKRRSTNRRRLNR